jgi:hypothetical protein
MCLGRHPLELPPFKAGLNSGKAGTYLAESKYPFVCVFHALPYVAEIRGAAISNYQGDASLDSHVAAIK